MQALILATNEHARLSPLTDVTPTALLPLADRPVLALTVELLARARVRKIAVGLCQSGGAVVSYCGDGGRWGVQLEYFSHPQPLGAAGTLRVAAPRVHETLLMLPGDAIVDLDIAAALAFHQQRGAAVTAILSAADRPNTRPASATAGLLTSCTAAPDALHYTGALICEPAALSKIPAGRPFDDYADLLPALLRAGVPVAAYTMDGYWNPLLSHADYAEAQRTLLVSAAGSAQIRNVTLSGTPMAPGIWVGPNTFIHPSARLSPPVWIGADCRIGEGVELGPDVLIGPDVVVDDGATVIRSAILPRTYLGRLVNCDTRIVSRTLMLDPQSGVSVAIVDPFLAAELPSRRRGPGTGYAAQRLLAGLLLLLALPLLVLLAPFVWLSAGRLLRQTPMVGSHPNDIAGGPVTFGLYGLATRRRDGRLTAVGAWLEAWEGDRIPALWNVLTRQCALVGVRPLQPAQAALLTEEWQQARFASPAGLTGLWYVQTPTTEDLDATIAADVYYVATSTWRDTLQILWQTPAAWRRRLHERKTISTGRVVAPGQ